MNSLALLPLIILGTTTTSPIVYEVATNEFFEHNTYSFTGVLIQKSRHHTIYALNTKACEIKDSYYDIIDETIKFEDKSTRKSFFSLIKDLINDRCLLYIQKRPRKNRFKYHMNLDYWYPDYNHLNIIPHVDHRVHLPRRSNRFKHRAYAHSKKNKRRKR